MVDEVSLDRLRATLAKLSGRAPLEVGGARRTVRTRHTGSADLALAMRYLAEVLSGQGIRCTSQDWEAEDDGEEFAGRNLIAELPGEDLSDEVVLLVAHADSIDDAGDERSAAPGVDDDASGCAALLEMARVMKEREFRRTVRFVFTTGEEQGYFGADAYAEKLLREQEAGGPDIVAVMNLDMIAWSSAARGPAPCRVKTRSRTGDPAGWRADLEIAEIFVEVTSLYGLAPRIRPLVTTDGDELGDTAQFWERGFPAIWVIEDDQDDWNPHYHSAEDDLEKANLPYCTALVKATLATAVHLAELAPGN